MENLRLRINYLNRWFEEGRPKLIDNSMFMFPQGMMSCMLQSHSRKHLIPFEKLRFEYEVLSDSSKVDAQPENGFYVDGMYLQGGKWDSNKKMLVKLDEG